MESFALEQQQQSESRTTNTLSGLVFFYVEKGPDEVRRFWLGCYSKANMEMIPIEETYSQPLNAIKEALKMNPSIARSTKQVVGYAHELHRMWTGFAPVCEEKAREPRTHDVEQMLADLKRLQQGVNGFVNSKFGEFYSKLAAPPPKRPRPSAPPAVAADLTLSPLPPPVPPPLPPQHRSGVSTLLNPTPPSASAAAGADDPLDTLAFLLDTPGLPQGTPCSFLTPRPPVGESLRVLVRVRLGGTRRRGLVDEAVAREGEHLGVLAPHPVLRRVALPELEQAGLPGHVVAHAEVDEVALADVLEGQEADLGEGRAAAAVHVGGDVPRGEVAVGAVEVRRRLEAVPAEGREQPAERLLLPGAARLVVADRPLGAGFGQQGRYNLVGGLQYFPAQGVPFLQSPQLDGQRGVREGSQDHGSYLLR